MAADVVQPANDDDSVGIAGSESGTVLADGNVDFTFQRAFARSA